MSLLLEALKKAELAKQSAGAPPTMDAASLEPVITRDTLPDISGALQIEPPDLTPPRPVEPSVFDTPAPIVDLPPEPPPQRTAPVMVEPEPAARPPAEPDPGPSRPRGDSGMEAERAAARQMFEAKEVDYNPKRPFYLTLGVLGLCAAGYGGYLWWELQPRTVYNAAAVKNPAAGGPAAPAPRPPAAAQPAPNGEATAGAQASPAPGPGQPAPGAVATPPVQGQAQPAQPVAQQSSALKPAAPAPGSPVPAAATRTPAAAGLPPTRSAAPGAVPAPQAAPARPRPPAGARPAEPRSGNTAIAINSSTPAVDPQLERAYEAFQKGDLGTARGLYQTTLQKEPSNRDALLGLAAIDMRARNYDLAETRYLRLLEADPRDAHAIAGLIALRGQTDPVQSESRLKSLIAQQPDAAHLHFALGNQLAIQGRWSEAQQSFFKAFTLDPDNPDFAFNLAVSLDHLRQGKLALEYYRRSVSLSGTRAASFDRTQVNNRIAELSR